MGRKRSFWLVCVAGSVVAACELGGFGGPPKGNGDDTQMPDGGTTPVSTCENPAQITDPAQFQTCGSFARCVPKATIEAIDANFAAKLSDDGCTAVPGSICTPEETFVTGGKYTPATCASLAGNEGRCLSDKILEVAAQGLMPQSTCPTGYKCITCGNVVNGQATGACTLACDKGATSQPKTLTACRMGAGVCILTTDIPATSQPNLQRLDCANGSLCVPTDIAINPATNTVACTGHINIINQDYIGVGIDVKTANVPNSGRFSPVPGKSADFACVPCVDPTTKNPNSPSPTAQKYGTVVTNAPGCGYHYEAIYRELTMTFR
jgi:hypothetical protein